MNKIMLRMATQRICKYKALQIKKRNTRFLLLSHLFIYFDIVSIIGLDSDKVQQLCHVANEEVEEAERVQVANFLCTGNYAVSGGVKGIEAVEKPNHLRLE